MGVNLHTTFEPVGSGQAVFTQPEVVEGLARWLDSPKAVLAFVAEGVAADTIVVVRGGTTTFLTPALTAGVKGVLTLQGAPECHLGILTREYGIPCVMGVHFDRGVRSERSEVIPADGALLRLDISAGQGQILIEAGARQAAAGTAVAADAMDAEQAAVIQHLLHHFKGEIPHGGAGDLQVRAALTSGALQLEEESLQRDLTNAEVNDLSAYIAWNLWDCVAARATEGESGLIPRQEYESVGFVQVWQRYPEFIRLLTERIGTAGIIDIGATARHEIGTKINLLHSWGLGSAVGLGRGVTLELGAAPDRPEDLRAALQFQRRLYRGNWGGGAMYSSMRGFRAPLLDAGWLERFNDERTTFTDPDQHAVFRHFNASTEMAGFLLHFDNRTGMSDTGPYPTADGGFVIVRDHFLQEDAYQWGQLIEGVPYAVTEAMFFRPDEPIDLQVIDIGTLFTQPANYLKHLTGAAVYARDRWDTPISDIRLLDADQMREIQTRCDLGTSRLYAHIAGMSKREKVMAGAKVYYTEFLLPFARAAGLWDEMVDSHDFFEWDRVTSQAYYRLVVEGEGFELIPRLFITGSGFPPLPEIDADDFGALHTLALRGILAALPASSALERAGLVERTPAGWMLSEAGRAAHTRLLAAERESFDLTDLSETYRDFLAANGPLKALCTQWQQVPVAERASLVDRFDDILDPVRPALELSAKILPRFAAHVHALENARRRLAQGELDYAVGARCASVHMVWMEWHEDYLQTQGLSREEEGSF
jgi:hypothetical protein